DALIAASPHASGAHSNHKLPYSGQVQMLVKCEAASGSRSFGSPHGEQSAEGGSPMLFGFRKKAEMPDPSKALPGRAEAIPTAHTHFVKKVPLKGPYPEGTEKAMFGLGCFWGAERVFWELPGVHVTAAGYSGGYTPNPTY